MFVFIILVLHTTIAFGQSVRGSSPPFSLKVPKDMREKPPLGRYWALIVGVSEYKHSSLQPLVHPVEDARELAKALTQYYAFEQKRLTLLPNPTRAELIGALGAYAPKGKNPLGEEDNLLVFYAGHGYWDKDFDEGYWLPSDAEQSNRANWVSNSDFQNTFKAIKAKHILLIADACFSGSIFSISRGPFISRAIEETYKLPSRRAITSGVLTEVPDKSIFKHYLIKRLTENTEQYLDAGKLHNDIKDPVSNDGAPRPLHGVIQRIGDQGGEFIFVKRK